MNMIEVCVISVLVAVVLFSEQTRAAESPKPLPPVPSKQQMAWQHKEWLMFCHFGIKTYYVNRNHMGTGLEDPRKVIFAARGHPGRCIVWPKPEKRQASCGHGRVLPRPGRVALYGPRLYHTIPRPPDPS